MRRSLHRPGAAGALVLAAAVLSAGRAQELKGPAKEALELAREAEAGKDVTKGAAALGKRLGNVLAAMRLYSPRSRGGVGLGGLLHSFRDGANVDALGFDLRAGYTFSTETANTFQLSVELTPAVFGDMASIGGGVLLGYQRL